MFGREVTVHRIQGRNGGAVQSQYIVEHNRSSGRFRQQYDEWQPVQLSSRYETAKLQRTTTILRYDAKAKQNDAVADGEPVRSSRNEQQEGSDSDRSEGCREHRSRNRPHRQKIHYSVSIEDADHNSSTTEIARRTRFVAKH